MGPTSGRVGERTRKGAKKTRDEKSRKGGGSGEARAAKENTSQNKNFGARNLISKSVKKRREGVERRDGMRSPSGPDLAR